MTDQPAVPPLLDSALAESLGHFMVAVSTVETILEIGIAKLLNLDPVRGGIVTGGLQFKSRTSILSSLLHLNETANSEAIAVLKKLSQSGERNDIVHSVIAYRKDRVKFYRRRVDAEMKLRERNYDASDLFNAASDLATLGAQLQARLGISDREIVDFFNALHKTSHS